MGVRRLAGGVVLQRMRRIFKFLVAGNLLLGAIVLEAQPSIVDSASRQAERLDSRPAATAAWRVGPFLGIAQNSPSEWILGATPGYDHFFVGAEASTALLARADFRLSYRAQLIPLVLLRGPEERAPWVWYPSSPTGERRSYYAFGIVPFGLELATPAVRDRVALFGEASAGGLLFGRDFPVSGGSRVNFTLEFGGGALLRTRAAQWLRLGYRYHHLSNAYYRDRNPGLDGHVLYLGYLWGVQLRRE